jgi:hypothetical protein
LFFRTVIVIIPTLPSNAGSGGELTLTWLSAQIIFLSVDRMLRAISNLLYPAPPSLAATSTNLKLDITDILQMLGIALDRRRRHDLARSRILLFPRSKKTMFADVTLLRTTVTRI